MLPSILIALSTFGSLCRADEPATATQPSPPAPDKFRYTLFDPTPGNLLRGMDIDRPNATNTPHTIDAGHVQLEAGMIDYAYFHDRTNQSDVRQNVFDVGQLNFRVGALDCLELNAVVNTYNSIYTHDEIAHVASRAGSFGDTTLGAKLNIWGNESGDRVWATALAIQPEFKVATARTSVGNGHFEFSVVTPFLLNLPDGFHLGLQTGVSYGRNSKNNGDITGFPTGISLDRVVIGKLDLYIEYACSPTTQAHTETMQSFNFGGTYPINDNVVLDVGMNIGLNKVSSDVEILAGISFRF